jgi:hypothetical protein
MQYFLNGRLAQSVLLVQVTVRENNIFQIFSQIKSIFRFTNESAVFDRLKGCSPNCVDHHGQHEEYLQKSKILEF